MDAKIQELTDKIYREGVEKGNEEANRIVAEAKNKEAAIIRQAEEQAQQLIAGAEKQADELTKNTRAELRLYTQQALEALKSEITDLITGRIVADNVKAATADVAFMQKTILEIVKDWVNSEQATIRTANAQALTAYFEANAKTLLAKGIKIEQVNGKPTDFTLAPADGSYKISFGEDEFIAYFKDFLRPQLIELLF